MQQQDNMLAATPSGLVLSSQASGWNGLELSQWQGVAPQEMAEASLANHLIVIHATPQIVRVAEQADDFRTEGVARAGDVNLLSAGEESYCRWDKPLSFLRLEIAPPLLEQVAAQTGNSSMRPEINPTFRKQDPKIVQVSQWLLEELQSGGAGGKLYAESLVNVLAVHLLRNYTAATSSPGSTPATLSKREVARAIEYMRSHLEQDISLEELAEAISLSPSYLARCFKRATGYAPHQYLITLRVNRARELLQTGHFSISEVAIQVGFADQSHLHRHFKRLLGVTPKMLLASR